MNTKYKTFIESLPVSHKHKVIVESAINNYSHFNHNGIKNKQYISFLESKVVDTTSASLVEALIRAYSVTHPEVLTEGFKDTFKNIGNKVKGVFGKTSPSDNYLFIGWGLENTLIAILKGDIYTIESVNGTKSLTPGMQFSVNSIPTKGEKMSLDIVGKGMYNTKDIIYDMNKGSQENIKYFAHMYAKYNKNKELHRQEDALKKSDNNGNNRKSNSVNIKWGNNSLSANFDSNKSRWVITNISGTKNLSVGDAFKDSLPEVNGKMSIQVDGKGTYNGSQPVSVVDYEKSNETANSNTIPSKSVKSNSIVTINWGNNTLNAKYNGNTDKWTITNISGTKNLVVGDVFSNKLPEVNGKMSIQVDGKGTYNAAQMVNSVDVKAPAKKPVTKNPATAGEAPVAPVAPVKKPAVKKPATAGEAPVAPVAPVKKPAVKKPATAGEAPVAPVKKPAVKKPATAGEAPVAPVRKPAVKKPVTAGEAPVAPVRKPAVKKQPVV